MSTEAVKSQIQPISVAATPGRNAISNVMTGFFAGIGLINWIAAINTLGGVNQTIHGFSQLPLFTEMTTGFYFYLGIQVTKLLVYLSMALVAFVGIVAAQMFRLHR